MSAVAEPAAPARSAESVYRQGFDAFLASLPASEPAFLGRLRRRAMERFTERGFPSPTHERWRFTNVAPIVKAAYPPADAPGGAAEGVTAEGVASLAYAGSDLLVFVDGHFAPELSQKPELPTGAFAGSLAEGLRTMPEKVEAHLGRHAGLDDRPDERAFVALNTAYFRDGAFVYVPRGAVIERPLHLLFLSSRGETASFPRTLVVAEQSSQVTVIESYVGLEGRSYFTSPVAEIVVGNDANVFHYKIQSESPEAFHLATQQSYQGRSCKLRSYSISLGGLLVRNDVNGVLDDEGSDCILNGLYLVTGKQHVGNYMRMDHAKPHCTSHELYKGILEGQGRSVFSGLIHVHPGAQKTDAVQSNQNLLLSPTAIANSHPQLEIFADDVRCTHGSTVGQLDDEAVFYLRSRGIGMEAARSLLTYAFASELVAGIQVEAVRKDLEEFLFRRLPKGEIVRQAI